MQSLALLLLGLLPFHNSYLGFKMVSFSHVPTSFIVQIPTGSNSLVDFTLDLSYVASSDSLYEITGYDTLNIYTKSKILNLTLGFDFLNRIMKRSIYNGEICGLVGVNPFFSLYSLEVKNETNGAKVTDKLYKIGSKIKIGTQYNFTVANIDMALEFLTDLLSVSYNNEDFSRENSSTKQKTSLNVEGFNFTSGKFSLYLLFKM